MMLVLHRRSGLGPTRKIGSRSMTAISLIRSRRFEYLGSVEAPDASAAELAAAEQFGLDA
jgi:hypothetical protein